MQGEVVLITGGSSGIGLAAARRFLDRGATVWLTARNAEKLRSAVSGLGDRVRILPADVSDVTSLDRLVEAIDTAEGRLDVLVNSAGQLALAPSEDSVEIAERLIRVNYLGTVRTVAAVLPLLRKGSRRSIVNLSSFAGKLTPPYWSAYSATKYAIQAYSSALRQELASERFHVGLVLPGPVQSPMTEDVLETPMYPLPFGVPVISPDRVARSILRSVLRRRTEVVVPGRFAPLLRLAAAFPRLVDLYYLPYRRGSNPA